MSCDRYRSVITSITVPNALDVINYYKKLFNTEEKTLMLDDNNKVIHSQILFGSTTFMISDEFPDMPKVSLPKEDNPITFYIYVDNVDEVFNRAVQMDSKILYPLENQFYGDRTATIVDPYGFRWTIATHIKDMVDDQMMKNIQQTGSGEINYRKKYRKYRNKLRQMKNDY